MILRLFFRSSQIERVDLGLFETMRDARIAAYEYVEDSGITFSRKQFDVFLYDTIEDAIERAYYGLKINLWRGTKEEFKLY